MRLGTPTKIPSLAATVCVFNFSVDQGWTTRSPNAKGFNLVIKCGKIKFGSFFQVSYTTEWNFSFFFYMTRNVPQRK
jgi:hypothetical protein